MTARHCRIVETVFRLACAVNCFVAAALYRDFGGGFCLGVGLAQLMSLGYEHFARASREASRAVVANQREIIASLNRSLALTELYAEARKAEEGDS